VEGVNELGLDLLWLEDDDFRPARVAASLAGRDGLLELFQECWACLCQGRSRTKLFKLTVALLALLIVNSTV